MAYRVSLTYATDDSDSDSSEPQYNTAMVSPVSSRAQSPSREGIPTALLNALDEIRKSISTLVLNQTAAAENISILSRENMKRMKEGQEILARIGIKGDIQTDTEGANGGRMTEDRDSDEEHAKLKLRTRNESILRNRQQLEPQAPHWQDGIPAKDIIRAIKPINGQDDMGVEDFIKIVTRTKSQCSQPQLLLDFILAEKITGNADKAIRYTPINTFNDLYEALRQNLKQTGSILSIKSKMESCKQGPNETIQNFSLRFKQILNELNYAVQASSEGTERQLRLEIEEKESINRYMLNLKREIGIQVRAMKPITLMEAQKEAAEYETWLKESQPIRNASIPPRPTPRFIQRPMPPPRIAANTTAATGAKALNQTLPLADRAKMSCHKCGKLGHFASQCFSKQNFQHGHFPTRPPQVRNIQEEDCLENQEMTQEEILEHEDYLEQAELMQFPEDYNPSKEEDAEENIGY